MVKKKTKYRCNYCGDEMEKDKWESHVKTKKHINEWKKTQQLFGKTLKKEIFDGYFSRQIIIFDEKAKKWR